MRWILAILLWFGTVMAFGQIVLKPSGDDAIKINPKSLAIEGRIRSQISESTWTYVFANPGWRGQADFLIKVPKDGVVTGFAYWYQGEKVIARVAAKERAAMIYKAIVRRQRDPALIEMVGKDTFRVRIFPIEPNADLKVELQMVQVLDQSPTGGRWKLDLARYGKLESTTVTVKSETPIFSTWPGTNKNEVKYEAKNQKPTNGTITAPFAGKQLYANLFAAKSGGENGFFTLVLTPNRPVNKLRAVISGAVTEVRTLSKSKNSVILTGRFTDSEIGTINVAGDNYRHVIPFNPGDKTEPNNPASKLWAWTSILQSKSRKQIEALSTRYTVPSKYTSWIAIPTAERERMKKEIAQAEWQVIIDKAMPELGTVGAKSARGQQIIASLKATGKKLGVNTDEWNPNSYEAMDEIGRKWITEVQRKGENSRLAKQYMSRIQGYKQLGFQPYVIQTFYADLARTISRQVTNDRIRKNKSSAAQRRESALSRYAAKSGSPAKQFINEVIYVDVQDLAIRIVDAERAKKQPRKSDLVRIEMLEKVGGQPVGQAVRQMRGSRALNDLYQLDNRLLEIYEKSPLDEQALLSAKPKRAELEKTVRAAGYSSYGAFANRLTNEARKFATSVAQGNAKVGAPPISDAKLRRAAELLDVDLTPMLKEAFGTQYQNAIWELGNAELEARRDQSRIERTRATLMRLEPAVKDKKSWQNDVHGRWTEPNPDERTAYIVARHAGKPGEPEKARLDAAMVKEYKAWGGDSRSEYRAQRLERLEALTELDLLDRQTPDADILAKIKTLEARANELRAKMGDPIVSIVAPNAKRVWAIMPDSTVLPMHRVPGTGRWEGRFDVPPGAKDGRYGIKIYVDGRAQSTTYINVDNTPPKIVVSADNGLVTVRANEPLARVIAITPDGQLISLHKFLDNQFSGNVPVESRFIATDRAHNRSDQASAPEVESGPWATEQSVVSFACNQPLTLNGNDSQYPAPWMRQILIYGQTKIARDTLGNLWQTNSGPDTLSPRERSYVWQPAPYILPRKRATAIAAQKETLYVAQMGGYSEFNGTNAIHHFPADLAGIPITAILPLGNRVWLGTQGRGLAEVDPATDSVSWHDERAGLTDDWITVMAVEPGGKIQIGTFVGGAWQLANGKWTQMPGTAGTSVTGITEDYISTRQGIFHQGVRIWPHETTAITHIGENLFVGTRNGVCQIPTPPNKGPKNP